MNILNDDFTPLSSQVAGSFPILKTADGRLYKPAMDKEIKFYNLLNRNKYKFTKFVPQFHGTTTVHRKAWRMKEKEGSDNIPVERVAKKCSSAPLSKPSSPWTYDRLVRKLGNARGEKVVKTSSQDDFLCLIMENCTYNFEYPHVLDLKIGTQQHGTHESDAKKASKSRKCKTTTSSSMGIRISGMQVYDEEGKLHRRDKYWGRGLNVQGLRSALRQFVAYPPDSTAKTLFSTSSYDFLTQCDGNSCEEPENLYFSRSTSTSITCSPYSVAHSRVRTGVIRSVITQLCDLIEAAKEVEWRFFGCSALISFSGGPLPASGVENTTALVRIIDFANAELEGHSGYDKGFVFGLEQMKRIFESFLQAQSVPP